jgi:Glycosyl hydrolase family 47
MLMAGMNGSPLEPMSSNHYPMVQGTSKCGLVTRGRMIMYLTILISLNGWGLTIVDSLDTMLIMDLAPEVDRAMKFIEKLDFTKPVSTHTHGVIARRPRHNLLTPI